MEKKLQYLTKEAKRFGLIININITKIMTFNNNNSTTNHETTIKIEDQIIKVVQEFTYLGAIIDKDGGTSKDVNRISKARKYYGMLHNIWQNPHMSQQRYEFSKHVSKKRLLAFIKIRKGRQTNNATMNLF